MQSVSQLQHWTMLAWNVCRNAFASIEMIFASRWDGMKYAKVVRQFDEHGSQSSSSVIDDQHQAVHNVTTLSMPYERYSISLESSIEKAHDKLCSTAPLNQSIHQVGDNKVQMIRNKVWCEIFSKGGVNELHFCFFCVFMNCVCVIESQAFLP